MTTLDDALKNLPKLLAERERELEDREKEIKRLKKSLEKDHPNLGTPNDILRLNIGGTRIDVLRRTLTQIEDSMLESRFSGRWDDSLEQDADGNFFIDQPPELFIPLINYLRAKASETPLTRKAELPVFDKPKELDDFRRMVDYYGLTLGLHPVGLYRVQSAKEETFLGKIVPDYKIESEEWATYYIAPLNTDARYINSYEVTLLGQSSTVQIGWIYKTQTDFTDYFASESGRGVGYGGASHSLDCVKNAIIIQGASSDLIGGESVATKEGSIIRSENKGNNWYIDSHLVGSTTEKGNNILEIKIGAKRGASFVPCISMKGSCAISTIELEF